VIGARFFNLFDAAEGKKVDIYRLLGVQSIRRNDVLVFHYPYPNNDDKIEMHLLKYYIKRCVAIAGDTFYIDNGIYKVKGITDSLGVHSRQLQLSERADSTFRAEVFNCFPNDSTYQWNIKNFGPLFVPGKGSKVQLEARNIVLYRKLIMYETDKGIEVRDGQVYLDGEVLSSYTFTKNYYFMAGDFALNSRDSRYWGLLPEDLIVGKAAFIWKSIDPYTEKYRWKRFFKAVK
ncbi:MAG: S26 family signal peptidase, partial [Tannerella sp.]|nr:S26 family signal peptidase [Tannerella sp.]